MKYIKNYNFNKDSKAPTDNWRTLPVDVTKFESVKDLFKNKDKEVKLDGDIDLTSLWGKKFSGAGYKSRLRDDPKSGIVFETTAPVGHRHSAYTRDVASFVRNLMKEQNKAKVVSGEKDSKWLEKADKDVDSVGDGFISALIKKTSKTFPQNKRGFKTLTIPGGGTLLFTPPKAKEQGISLEFSNSNKNFSADDLFSDANNPEIDGVRVNGHSVEDVLKSGNTLGGKLGLTGLISGTVVGAPIGAITGLLSGDKKKSTLKRLLLGGLIGGAAGAGLGGLTGYGVGHLAAFKNKDLADVASDALTWENARKLKLNGIDPVALVQ